MCQATHVGMRPAQKHSECWNLKLLQYEISTGKFQLSRTRIHSKSSQYKSTQVSPLTGSVPCKKWKVAAERFSTLLNSSSWCQTHFYLQIVDGCNTALTATLPCNQLQFIPVLPETVSNLELSAIFNLILRKQFWTVSNKFNPTPALHGHTSWSRIYRPQLL